MLDALDRIGLGEVDFKGSADLRWERDRKLGGISAGDFGRVISIGGFLNIKPPDMDLYLQVVRVPEGKFKDKLVSDMSEYVCTAEEVAGRVPCRTKTSATRSSARWPTRASSSTPGALTDVEQGALVEDLESHRDRRLRAPDLVGPVPRRARRRARASGSPTTRARSSRAPVWRSTPTA